MVAPQVLVVGAGPTGLVLALWLRTLGIEVRIVDKTAAPGTTSRALAVQARTLELYRQLDLAATVVERGHQVPAVNLWARGERAARVPFGTIGKDLTPYAFLEIFPQDEHERFLIERLERFGVRVERQTELKSFEEVGDRIAASLRGPDGQSESCEVDYIAGCDGAHSTVRQSLGLGYPGGTYRQLFYVADVEAKGPAVDGELHIDLDQSDFLAVFPMAGEGRVRLIGTVEDDRAEHGDTLGFDDVSRQAIEHLRVDVEKVNWFSTYRVHHRVTEHFRKGRAFVLGDAAHVHSPVGGQGMNTGIGDAINLAWKLAAVLSGRATDRLLDSFEAERIGFAKRLVATTDRAFTLVTAEGTFADLVRTRLVPFIAPKAMAVDAIRAYLFRTVSQITLHYRGLPLSAGAAGKLQGGDRLPWVRCGEEDNMAPLPIPTWQVHVYGAPHGEVVAWCADRDVPLRVFEWTDEHGAAGLMRDAVYLLRPDTYIAVADASGDPQVLVRYFADRSMTP